MNRRKERQRRDCETCIAYYNMLGGTNNRCGLGFRVVESAETDDLGQWDGFFRPYEDECEIVAQPKTKEELVETSRTLGIEWDIDEILDPKEHDLGWW